MHPEADDLYALPPAEFTAARDALAARLRGEGRRDDAAAVRALRRPTTAAAALNRTVRAHPEALEELLAAGRNLARAQERLIAGEGDRSVLREAAEHVREAISALTSAAVAEHGLSAASTDLVRSTLHAALADAGVREALAAGRLHREAEAGGVGFPLAAPAAPAGRERRAPGAKAPARRAAARKAAAERAEAAERLREATRAVHEAERRLEDAAERAGRAVAAVEDLRSRLAAAEDEAERAEREAGDLRAELRAAKSAEAAAAERAG